MKGPRLTEELYTYIIENFVPDEELLTELISETEKQEIPLIQVAPEQAKFLYLVSKMINAKNALEIGTLTGYSGIHIARGLTNDGKLVTVDINPKNASVAGIFFEKAGLTDKVEIVVSNAVEYMKELTGKNQKYDFIFVDADKQSYPKYYEFALQLSHPGTVIAFDNTLRDGKIIDEAKPDEHELKATQELNKMMASDKRIESLLIPIGDGFTMGRVK